MPLSRMRFLLLLVAVGIGLTAFAIVRPVSSTPAATRAGELVADGAWCWFQDPRAVHYVGAHDRTYIGYVTSTGDVDVVSEDTHSAALAHTTLHAGLQRDDHAAPGLEVLPSGQIAVFYSKHTGSEMYYRISTRPEDITSFGPERTVGVNTEGSAGYTYANPIYLSDEKRTYLFFRAANSKPAVTWSDDNLKTWAPAQPLLSGSAVRPYVKYATNGKDKIFITFDDGHPRDVSHNSVYALTYSKGQLSTMDGTAVATMGQPASLLGLPPAPVNIATVSPLYDGGGADGKAWVQDAALDSQGNPVVLFATFPTDSNHHYHYARWDGKQWQQTDFTSAGGTIDAGGQEPDYSGGISLDPNDVSTVYTSREINGQWEIQQWHTTNGGKSFGTPVAVTQNSTQKNVRPVVPWGPAGPVKLLWMSGTYTNWKAGYKTQLRELTSDPAPTTTRMSAPTSAVTGTVATITARVVRGYQGRPKSGVQVELWGHSAGRPYSRQATATTDSAGLAHFRITAAHTAQYQSRASAGNGFGASTSAPATVTTVTGTQTKLSVDHTTVHSGTAVHVGLRLVNPATGHGIAGAHVQLWQRVSGGTWTRRTSVAVDSGGLAHVTTRPSQRVSYQARYAGNSSYAGSSSSPRTVAVSR